MSDLVDVLLFGLGAYVPAFLPVLANSVRIGSFYAFILNRSDRVRLTVVARSNYEAVRNEVCITGILGQWINNAGNSDQERKSRTACCPSLQR